MTDQGAEIEVCEAALQLRQEIAEPFHGKILARIWTPLETPPSPALASRLRNATLSGAGKARRFALGHSYLEL